MFITYFKDSFLYPTSLSEIGDFFSVLITESPLEPSAESLMALVTTGQNV